MPFWRQNAAQENPRNGTAPTRDFYPLSVTVFAPQAIPPSEVNPGSTNPSSGFRAQPIPVVTFPVFGEHDGLAGALMKVPQADLYNSAPNPWPAAGTWEQPGGPIAASQLVRLAPTTSAHPGLSQATGAGPAMVFTAPPVFTVQTQPIYALGL